MHSILQKKETGWIAQSEGKSEYKLFPKGLLKRSFICLSSVTAAPCRARS